MALPGQRGATNPQNADEVAALHALIVRLKFTHPRMTWKQIGEVTGYHWKYCQTVFYRERAKSAGAKLIEQHVVEVLEELDELADHFRPFVTGRDATHTPPPKHLLALLLKIIDRKMRWSGASSWARQEALASKDATASGDRTATAQSRSHSSSVVEGRHRQVIALRLNNPHMTWKEIGLITSFHPNYCSLIFARAKGLAIRSEALEGYRQQILDELEAVGDALRVALPSESGTEYAAPHKDHVTALLNILDRKVKLLGLDLVVPANPATGEISKLDSRNKDHEIPEEGQNDDKYRWITTSQLYHAGLLDLVKDSDGYVGLVISEKGHAAGIDLSPGWSERWRDVYVGYDRNAEYVQTRLARQEEMRALSASASNVERRHSPRGGIDE